MIILVAWRVFSYVMLIHVHKNGFLFQWLRTMAPQKNNINEFIVTFQLTTSVDLKVRVSKQDFQSNCFRFNDQENFKNYRSYDDVECEGLSQLKKDSTKSIEQHKPKRFLSVENIPEVNRNPRKQAKIFRKPAATHQLFCLIVILFIRGNHGIKVSDNLPYDLPTPAIPVLNNNALDFLHFGPLADGAWSIARELGIVPSQIAAPSNHGFVTDFDLLTQDHVLNSNGHQFDVPNYILDMIFRTEVNLNSVFSNAVHQNTRMANSSLPDTTTTPPERECVALSTPRLTQQTETRNTVRRSNIPSMVKSKTLPFSF